MQNIFGLKLVLGFIGRLIKSIIKWAQFDWKIFQAWYLWALFKNHAVVLFAENVLALHTLLPYCWYDFEQILWQDYEGRTRVQMGL